jgi:hypothetical protein
MTGRIPVHVNLIVFMLLVLVLICLPKVTGL